MRRTVRAFMAAAFVAAVAVVGISIANAASLGVDAGALSTTTAGQPCPGNATAVPSAPSGAQYTGVTVTLPSTACTGQVVQVTVLDGTTVVRQGETTASGATASVTGLTAYTAQAGYTVQATVSGWTLPTAWSYTPAAVDPIVPGNSQTVITAINWTIQNSNQACAQISVRTNTTQQSWWRVDFNVDQAPFYGATSGYQVIGGQVEFIPGSGTAVNGVLGIQGSNPGWGRSTSTSAVRTFTICHYGLPNPPDVPSAYTVAYSQGTWTDTEACIRATITGNGTSQFYFGWRAQIDMTSAYQRIQSTGREVRRVQQDTWGDIVDYSPAFSPSVSTYDLANRWQGVLRLSESRTVGICAYEY